MPTAAETRMKRATYDALKQIVHEQLGISLGERKEALVRARVGRRMRALGMDDYESYLRLLEADDAGEEMMMFLDAICTNVTAFYREPHGFTFLASQLREALARGQRRFRYWSAACSTGEEPLTLAMSLLDAAEGHDDVDIRILATDVSTKVLGRCADACYSADRLALVPVHMRERWFDALPAGGEVVYRAKRDLLDLVVYRRVNLAVPPFPMRGPLDAVLCRNVMIYFDDPVRRRLIAEMRRLLGPGGHLVVGNAESLTGMADGFEYIRPSIYARR